MNGKYGNSPHAAEERSIPGGLLANVSLLTTGGSSLQQLTNQDAQLLSTRNQTIQSNSAVATSSNQKHSSKKPDAHVDTSTPARAFDTNKIVYGFDLSPVHSHEMPGASLSKKNVRGSKSDMDISRYSLQSGLEERLFSDSRSAPNFMQAPSVASSHQSRMSLLKSDDADTMMSQVYSQSTSLKTQRTRPSTSKKSAKTSKSPLLSPSRVSPRKSSKLYSHVHGSGYGVSSPWKSQTVSKPTEKRNSSSKKKSKSKSDSSEFLSDSALKLLANMKNNEDNAKLYSKFEKVSGNTFKVASSRQSSEKKAKIKVPETNQNSEFQGDIAVEDSVELQNLQERYGALEEECQKLKDGNTEANKENYLLTAKLHKLVAVNESTDPVIIDSLNDDSKDLEIAKFKKEIFEQERLLTGYQQENEKLYRELAKLKIQQRENESAMYNENLKLKSKIASLNEELNEKEAVIKDKNHLLLDQENDRRLCANAGVQTNQATSPPTPRKADDTKDKIIADLQQKLAFFSENQSLMREKDERLQKADEDVRILREKVQEFKSELSTKNKHSKKQEKETVVDLRRQVKELEISLFRAQGTDHVKDLLHGGKQDVILEERCQQLEERLKSQEGQFSNNMHSLHQLYINVNKDYEERVEKLSDQLQVLKKHQSIKSGESCPVEKYEKLKHEHERSKLRIDQLQRELNEEKLTNASKVIPSKSKKKSRSQINESTYRPDHFMERSPVKSEVEKSLSHKDFTSRILNLTNENEKLLKEVAQWKTMCENMDDNQKKVKGVQDNDVEIMRLSHKKLLDELTCDKSLLQEKLNELQLELLKCLADLTSSKAREEALQLQIRNLLDDLQDTRRASPNATLRQLDALQSQIRMLDFRQKSREDKLNKVVASSADEYLKAEIASLHKTISDKNLLISKFQCELDAILRVLETLQNRR